MRIDTLEHVQKTITREGIVCLRFGDQSADPFDYFSNADPNACAEYLATVCGQYPEAFIMQVQGWKVDTTRKRGAAASPKNGEDLSWKLRGTNSAAVMPAPSPGAPAPGAPAQSTAEMDLRIQCLRLELKLEAEKQTREMLERLIEEGDDDDDDDDDQEKAAPPPAANAQAQQASDMEQARELVNLIREVLGKPAIPTPRAPASGEPVMNGSPAMNGPMPEGTNEEEAHILRAIRRAKANNPEGTGEMISQVLNVWGDNGEQAKQ